MIPEIPKSPRQVKSQQVKDKLLATTTELLKKYGFEYVTVHNICTSANISTGSFYHHFKNKDDLLAYYLVAAFEHQSAEFEKITGEDVLNNVLRCYELYTSFLLEQGIDFVKNYYTTGNRGLATRDNIPATREEADIPILFQTFRLLSDAQASGCINPSRTAEDISEDLCVIEKGVIFDWCLCNGCYDLNAYSQELLKNYLLAFLTDKYKTDFPAWNDSVRND